MKVHKIFINTHAYSVAIHNNSNMSAHCMSKKNDESKSEKVRIFNFKHISKMQLSNLK